MRVLLTGFALACGPPPRTGPPNILLVSLDTVRADHTSTFGYPRNTTPTLTELAEQGTRFTQAFSQANESAWSHAALFTGRYGSELARPVYETWAAPPTVTFVSEALQAYGYQTAMFSAGGHVDEAFGFNQGWDHYSAEEGFGTLYDTAPKAEAWITGTQAEKPWFAFVHAYDAHRPYLREGPWNHIFSGGPGRPLAELLAASPCVSEMVLGEHLYPDQIPRWFEHPGGGQILDPEIYERLKTAPPDTARVALLPEDRLHIQDHYDGGLLYVDTQLGLLLARLESAGRLDDTVVVVVSDHGEDLLDHGYMNHRTGLFDSTTRVPLVIWGPGFEGGKTVEGLTDARDVAATILALAGALPPAGAGGRDLRAVARGEQAVDAVFMEGVMDQLAVRTATHRLVVSGIHLEDSNLAQQLASLAPTDSRVALYALGTDPRETKDVKAEQPAVAAELLARLTTWRQGLRVGDHRLSPDEVPPEVAAEMRAHGYWGETPEKTVPSDGSGGALGTAEPAETTPRPARKENCQDRFLIPTVMGGNAPPTAPPPGPVGVPGAPGGR